MKTDHAPLLALPLIFAVPLSALASEDVKDMSDPLSVYTQVGSGFSDKGLNVKVGQSYDTGEENLGGMNILEVKGIGGEIFGWNNDPGTDNSIDSLRFRHYEANLKTGRGVQMDINYQVESETGTASYSVLQALPSLGPVRFYPLAGVGVAFGNNVMGDDGEVVSGYSVPGTFAVVGTYAKVSLTDNLWFNYNPMWTTTLSGSDIYKDHGLEGSDSLLSHEVSLSYQIAPRFNVRYFSNWTENTSMEDGSHRLEFNYQL